MLSTSKCRIITNNPLVVQCLPGTICSALRRFPIAILVTVRDLIYAGYRLYTHPLSGSVKPNETPYKSIVVSRTPEKMDMQEAEIISRSIEVFDKFTPRNIPLTDRVLRDFQLIDYTLLCGALGLDAVAGLSNRTV